MAFHKNRPSRSNFFFFFLERDASHLPCSTERDAQARRQHKYLTLLHVLEALQQIFVGTNAPSKCLRQSYRNLHQLVMQ